MVGDYLYLTSIVFIGAFLAISAWLVLYEILIAKPKRDFKRIELAKAFIENEKTQSNKIRVNETKEAPFGNIIKSDEGVVQAFSHEFRVSCSLENPPLRDELAFGLGQPNDRNSMMFQGQYKVYGETLNEELGWSSEQDQQISGSLYLTVASNPNASVYFTFQKEEEQYQGVTFIEVFVGLRFEEWKAIREEYYRFKRGERNLPVLELQSSNDSRYLSDSNVFGGQLVASLSNHAIMLTSATYPAPYSA